MDECIDECIDECWFDDDGEITINYDAFVCHDGFCFGGKVDEDNAKLLNYIVELKRCIFEMKGEIEALNKKTTKFGTDKETHERYFGEDQ